MKFTRAQKQQILASICIWVHSFKILIQSEIRNLAGESGPGEGESSFWGARHRLFLDFGDVDGLACESSSSRILKMGVLFCNTCHASITCKLKKKNLRSRSAFSRSRVAIGWSCGHWGVYTRIPQAVGLISHSLFLLVLEAGNPRSRAQFLVCGQLSSCHVLTWQRGEGRPMGSPL